MICKWHFKAIVFLDVLEFGFRNWRVLLPDSTQITSPHQFHWLVPQASNRGRRLCLITAGNRVGDNLLLLLGDIVEIVGILVALLQRCRQAVAFAVTIYRPIWWNTSRLDCTQTIVPVTQQERCEAYLGRPMEQTAQGTCAPVDTELSREGDVHVLHWPRAFLFKMKFQFMWTNTFRLDLESLGQQHTGPSKSWGSCLRPMKQTMSDTCAIVACTVALEGIHRKVYEESNGVAFPDKWQVAKSWQEMLRLACERNGVWKEREGANVGDVLIKIKELAGVVTSIPGLLMPLLSWEMHSAGLTRKRVAELIDLGPCIGRLWVCPWYHHFNADNGWVYRGCGRDKHARDDCKELYRNQVMGSHAVVCFAYRFCENGEEMHVLVLDNHDDDGPQRWIDVEELDAIFTLSVECLTNGGASPPKEAARRLRKHRQPQASEIEPNMPSEFELDFKTLCLIKHMRP